ncbi:MAG: hypothetical protein P8Y20_09930 [Gammaproteobacteria bacterium]|jgi:hypothetical protein
MHERLLKLIGKKFHYLGNRWVLIEVMPENDSVVLQLDEPHTQIQSNRFGSPSRFSTETLTVSISAPDSDEVFSEEISILLSGIIKE